MKDNSTKHSFLLVVTLITTPFIFFLGKNFLQTEFFTAQYFLVTFIYSLIFVGTAASLLLFSKKSLVFVLFFAYFSFLQFYFFDMQLFLKIYKNGSTGKEVLAFIVLVSFLGALISRSLIFKNFVLILLFLNVALSVYHLIPATSKFLYTFFTTSSITNNSSNITSLKSIKYPNIFYIVPDGLASPKVLKDYINLDYQYSIKKLAKKGFSVPTHNYSSYNMTRWSLAALFKMDYPVTEKASGATHYPTIRENNPEILKYLKKNNYKFVIVPPYWGGCPVHKDYMCLTPINNSYLSYFFQDYAVKKIFQYSFIKIFLERFNNSFGISINYDLDDAGKTTLNKLKQSPEIWSEGGVFTMIHMMMPHTPYRDENCSIIDDYIAPSKNGYKSSVYCTLSRIHDLSDFIIKNYPNATVVVQSDHGVDPVIIPNDKKFIEIPELSIDYKLSNFTAVRGCNAKQAAALNQTKIVKYVVECIVNGISDKQIQNRSFWGFYPGEIEFGKLFPVRQK